MPELIDTLKEKLTPVDPGALPPMLDPAKTALIVVDIQTDFAAPDGLIGSFGTDMSNVPAVLDNIESLISDARKAGATVGFMRVMTKTDTDPEALKLLMQRRGRPGGEGICRVGSGGEDFYRVKPEPGDIEIEKLLFNSFHGTDLEDQLRARGIDTLLVCGISTDCCVDSTVRDGFHRGFNMFVVSDACDAYDPALHYGALWAMQKNCALLTTTEAVKAAWGA